MIEIPDDRDRPGEGSTAKPWVNEKGGMNQGGGMKLQVPMFIVMSTGENMLFVPPLVHSLPVCFPESL